MEATISEQPETNQDLLVPQADEDAPEAADPQAVSKSEGAEEPQPVPVDAPQPTLEADAQPESALKEDTPAPTDPALISQLAIQPLESPFAQMEAYLVNQLEKSDYYRKLFEEQGNPTLGSQFDTYYTLTEKDLKLLRRVWQEKAKLPKYKFEVVRVTSVPTNVDIKDKELRIFVRTLNLPVADGAVTYIIGEFEFPLTGKSETATQSANRWAHSVKLEPSNLFCCTGKASRQLDMVTSTTVKPFYDKDSSFMEYERELEYFVERGRSRTLKRKFKPVKLSIYERTSFLKRDKKIGTLQVKIDSINDEASLRMRVPIMNGRKQTDAMADIRVRVREPLVEKSTKTHEEKFLILT